ncbi:hypothetical protein GCM10010294_48300 [Streptomyces griseoloalbus]|nr:hypothetical protein GCM10010294_48300 [Streptomyces griseoloalbus]
MLENTPNPVSTTRVAASSRVASETFTDINLPRYGVVALDEDVCRGGGRAAEGRRYSARPSGLPASRRYFWAARASPTTA